MRVSCGSGADREDANPYPWDVEMVRHDMNLTALHFAMLAQTYLRQDTDTCLHSAKYDKSPVANSNQDRLGCARLYVASSFTVCNDLQREDLQSPSSCQIVKGGADATAPPSCGSAVPPGLCIAAPGLVLRITGGRVI